ncbi:MAG TPA: alpha/beta hydrolase-fold protein [Brevundimonas sp.]
MPAPGLAVAQDLTVIEEGPAVQPRAVQFIVRSRHADRHYLIQVTPPARPPVFPGQKAAVVYALDGGWGVAGAAGWVLGGGGAMSPAYMVTIGYPPGQPSSREADLLPRPVARQDGSMARGGGSDRFTRFLLEELKPFIEARYPVDPSRGVLFGHSLGGIFTANVLADHPDAFAGYLIASPSVWADTTAPDRLRTISANGAGPRVFVGWGEREEPYMLEGGRQVAAALAGRGDQLATHVFPGDLHITYYPAALGEALPFLLPRQAPLEFPLPVDVPEDGLARLAGRYALQNGVEIGVAPTAQGLRATIPGMPPVDLKPRSPTSFFIPEMDVRVDFEPNAMILFINGDRIDAVRIP